MVDDSEHILRLGESFLSRVVADVQSEMTRQMKGPFRGSHGRILHEIEAEGTRPTVIAEAIGISRQGVGQRLREMEALGWTETIPDPQDRRAVMVRRTPLGETIWRISRRAISVVEEKLAAQIGAENFASLRTALRDLAQPYSDQVGAQPTRTGGNDE